jgi:hypothetical protein
LEAQRAAAPDAKVLGEQLRTLHERLSALSD